MKTRSCSSILVITALLLTQAPIALAATTWYVNGVGGSDSDNCKSSLTACKTIGHAISLAAAGDSVRIAAATYAEHLTIVTSLELIGAAASSTIIDGTGTGRVIEIPAGSVVTLANVTIRNGSPQIAFGVFGGGIVNNGTLTINSSAVSGNVAFATRSAYGGGIWNNRGTLTINNSILSGNTAGCGTLGCNAGGAGINNSLGIVTINNSTIAGNIVRAHGPSQGGGILNAGGLTISNSTISGNGANEGGGIYGNAHLQNSIVAGGCSNGPVTSIFSLSSDKSCNLNGPGDLNNVNPKLGTLGNYGGPTQTIPLLSGSPAIDAGNPSGCTDSQGRLLKTDQRGLPRPNTEDRSGCDMGAFERQAD
jgi:hypothetical protein